MSECLPVDSQNNPAHLLQLSGLHAGFYGPVWCRWIHVMLPFGPTCHLTSHHSEAWLFAVHCAASFQMVTSQSEEKHLVILRGQWQTSTCPCKVSNSPRCPAIFFLLPCSVAAHPAPLMNSSLARNLISSLTTGSKWSRDKRRDLQRCLLWLMARGLAGSVQGCGCSLGFVVELNSLIGATVSL